MGAAFTGYLQDRVKAQGQSTGHFWRCLSVQFQWAKAPIVGLEGGPQAAALQPQDLHNHQLSCPHLATEPLLPGLSCPPSWVVILSSQDTQHKGAPGFPDPRIRVEDKGEGSRCRPAGALGETLG